MPNPKILDKSTAPHISLVVTGDPPYCGPPAKYRDEIKANPVLKPIVLKYITDQPVYFTGHTVDIRVLTKSKTFIL